MDWGIFKHSLAQRDLVGLDSEFTLSTKRLVSLFKADGAHLNKWWVMTPVDWICPCCRRRKSEIVRLNKNNFLSCQLHEHHDHMKEVVKSLFEELSTKKKVIVADALSERFAIKTAFSLSAYDNTVICSDCNKADADAKRLVKCHKFFSFSPAEISEFINVASNREHQINRDAAKKVWERVEPIFNIRMDMARKFATIAAEKQDWYQPSEKTAKQTETSARHFFRLNGLLEFEQYWPESLLYNTEVFKGTANSWRMKNNPIAKRRPTSNEVAHLSSTRGKYWNRYDDFWICPCCKRIKYQCVRASKNNPWILEIKRVPLFIPDENKIEHNSMAMCADCVDSAINLGREILRMSGLNTSFPSSVISLEELSSVIIPREHSKHAFKNDLIDEMLPSIIDRCIGFFKCN
jgi:rubredoxin